MLTKDEFIIAVDMDDTIENLLEAWTKWLNKKYGYDVDYTQIYDWRMGVTYPELTNEQIFEPLSLKDFWNTVTPKEDAMIYLKKLYEEGFKIYICTSSHYNTIQYKCQSIIERYFSFLDYHNIITMFNKQLLKCNVLVDDGTHNILGDYYGILYTAPHNYSFNTEKYTNVSRANNWEEVYNQIKELYKKNGGI